MSPEETLDWLANQHFDQCREQRPIQDWMRKMKSQLPPLHTWAGLMRGVRVQGDTVVISTKDNEAARELCGALIEEMNK